MQELLGSWCCGGGWKGLAPRVAARLAARFRGCQDLGPHGAGTWSVRASHSHALSLILRLEPPVEVRGAAGAIRVHPVQVGTCGGGLAWDLRGGNGTKKTKTKKEDWRGQL